MCLSPDIKNLIQKQITICHYICNNNKNHEFGKLINFLLHYKKPFICTMLYKNSAYFMFYMCCQ